MSNGAWRIGDFHFQAGSGELRPADGATAPGAPARHQPKQRLPPQPARLLALLAERAGEVVTHEEIREHLWPDVQVDFEQGLHFCVRQVRSALGDSASQPRYVETLPRRGYRLRSTVEALTDGQPPPPTATEPAQTAAKPSAGAIRKASFTVLAIALATVFVVTWSERREDKLAGSATPRLAVMPFESPAELGVDLTPVAERLLLRFGAVGVERLAVIGPTTTGAWTSDLRQVHQMMDELELDYVVNGRFLDNQELLVELIRADGAHLWVEAFAELEDPKRVSDRVGDSVLDTLELR